MPAAKPPEFRRRAVELARRREKPIAEIAHDLGIAESCLRRWLKQDDIDAGRTEGVSTDERAELVRLRRELRVAQMEIGILKRASPTTRCCDDRLNPPNTRPGSSATGCTPPACWARWGGSPPASTTA